MSDPLMTVILVVGRQRGRGARCLQGILSQSCIDQLEVILIDYAAGTDTPLPGSDHPAVRLLPPPAVQSYGDAIACGIRNARAPVVAMIEEHCLVFPGWAEALIRAHEGGYAVVSGEIHNGNPGSGASDLIYRGDYRFAMAPRPRGETTYLIGHNSSFKRDILLGYDDDLVDLLQNDLLLSWRLQQDGHRLYAEPDARFAHVNETYHRSHWAGLYLSNRAFGAVRARTNHWSPLRRAFYVLIVPVAPFIRLARQLGDYARRHRDLLPTMLRYVPALWAFHASAVAGQAVGLIWGMGDANERFLYFELEEYRYVEGVDVLKIFTRVVG